MIPFRHYVEEEFDFWAQAPQAGAPTTGKIRLFRGFLEEDDLIGLRGVGAAEPEGGFAPSIAWPIPWEPTVQRPPRRVRKMGVRILLDELWMGGILTVKRKPVPVVLPPRLVMAKASIGISPIRARLRTSVSVDRGEYEVAVALGLEDVTDFR